jgi:hypothetical protein
MTHAVRLLERLSGATDALLLEIHLKPESISRLRLELQEACSCLLEDLTDDISSDSLQFARHLATMASLCKRLYFGAVDLPYKRKEALGVRILQFFVHFRYPLDLTGPPTSNSPSLLAISPKPGHA